MVEHLDNQIPENSPSQDSAKPLKQKQKKSKIFKKIMSQTGFLDTTLNFAERLLVDYAVFKRIENGAKVLAEHPVFALPVCALSISLGIPLFIFVIFACLTACITFIGFLLFEGTVLTIGSVVLAVVLIFFFAIFLMVLIVISVAYFGLQKLHILDDKS